jgi:hypothetical protein
MQRENGKIYLKYLEHHKIKITGNKVERGENYR